MKNFIKRFLEQKGITQKEVAEAIGMTEAGLSKAIKGSATKDTIDKVAQFLDVEPNDLIDNSVLCAKYSSDKTPLHFGDVEVPCYVLEDGTRVFSGRGIQKAIGYESKSGQWMKSFIKIDGLSPYFYAEKNNIVEQLQNPIKFKRNNAGGSQSMTYGYDATLLIDICSAIIDANRAGVYADNNLVAHADIIIRAVAKTGIIALVDEATGYNRAKERAKDELQNYLKVFLNKEAATWEKMFDDDFFEALYKMRNWTWTQTSKRPSVVGKWINEIVYERIAPLVFNEIQLLNPKNENGNRKYKYHQFFTSDVGKPKLKQHLDGVKILARASGYNWARFMHLLDKAYPKQYQEQDLFDDIDFEEV